MGHFRDTIHIDAPIDHVWEVFADTRRIPEYDVNMIEVKDYDERIDQVGAKFTSVVRVLGRKMNGTFETTKVERPHILEQKVTLPGGGHATASFTFVEADGGTDQTMVTDYELPFGMFSGVAEKFLANSIERDGHHTNENFKALCEASVPQLV